MNKLNKLFAILATLIIVMSVTLTVNATTNTDVINYISSPQTVNGVTLKLTSSQVSSLTTYLTENPVNDADAANIISNLDAAKAVITNSGATSLSGLTSDQKTQVMNYVKTAGNYAGLTIEFDTVNETVTVKDLNGNIIISAASYADASKYTVSGKSDSTSSGTTSSSSLVYTGSNYSVAIIGVAVVAIATIAVIVKKNSK